MTGKLYLVRVSGPIQATVEEFHLRDFGRLPRNGRIVGVPPALSLDCHTICTSYESFLEDVYPLEHRTGRTSKRLDDHVCGR